MKARNILLTLLYFLCIVIVSPTKAQITINRSDIPVATYFYMPVGDRNSDIRSDLVFDVRYPRLVGSQTSVDPNNNTQVFPGNYWNNGEHLQGWTFLPISTRILFMTVDVTATLHYIHLTADRITLAKTGTEMAVQVLNLDNLFMLLL